MNVEQEKQSFLFDLHQKKQPAWIINLYLEVEAEGSDVGQYNKLLQQLFSTQNSTSTMYCYVDLSELCAKW